MRRLVVGTVLAAGLAVGILALRDATLTTHQPVPARSELAVVVRSSTHRGEGGQTLAEMTEALRLVCRLEVSSDPMGRLEDLGDGRFRMVLRPALDHSNRRQFRGCVEDWRIDHLRVDVETMQDQRARADGPPEAGAVVTAHGGWHDPERR